MRDSGVGIAPEMLPRVFNMFTQVTGAPGCAQVGLGIGLALAQSLVELHGGQILAQSQGVGLGSDFIVRLPLAAQERLTSDADAPNDAQPLLGRRLLVVDDNRDVADSLGMLLQCLGANVETAYDGPTALEIFERTHPLAVLLDLGMPGMDGF